MKKWFVWLPIYLFCACGNSVENPTVHVFGALRTIMHDGDISAKVALGKFRNMQHIFALGAVENLQGEILIIDGKASIAHVAHDSLVIDSTLEKRATLLVYAVVDNWQEFALPANINNEKELAKFIAIQARKAGLNPQAAFPFQIIGRAKSLHWHVIDWPAGDTGHSHKKHKNAGLHGMLKNPEISIVGFYSTKHQMIFTHRTSNVHMHFKTLDDAISAHVDSLALGGQMILKLPLN